jgi:hypothetical protein
LVKPSNIIFFECNSTIIYHRCTDRANPYFALQRRRGHDEEHGGLASLFVATIDSVLDSKVGYKCKTFYLIRKIFVYRQIVIEFFIKDLILKFIIVNSMK